MAKRRYNQYCAMARALDVVGERWTLLIIRELLTGPKRFKDLLNGLLGMGTNLLASRLKDLERHGIVRRTILPPPSGSRVYELTESGQALEPVVMALARWGARLMGPPRNGDKFRPIWAMLGMKYYSFDPKAARGVRAVYEFQIDGEVFQVRVEAGAVEAKQGRVWQPDLVLATDSETFLALATGQTSAAQALRSQAIRIKGDRKLLFRCIEMFALPSTN